MSADRYRATLERLYRRRRFGLRPGLDVITAMLDALGHPERAYPALHITGSKGKGSVATIAQAILSAHGVRTGLFTSPHLSSYRERIRVDGRPIARTDVVEGVARMEALADDLERTGRIDRAPTFFELTTALAFDYFASERVGAAVVEVGIGGRLDATNVLDTRVGVVTTIELEHTELLGPTVSAIAKEKAGILRPGAAAVVGTLPQEADRVVAAAAGRLGLPLWRLGSDVKVENRTLAADDQTFSVVLPDRVVSDLRLPLLGSFQPGNAALALAACERFLTATGRDLDGGAVRAALGSVRWRGRLERVGRRPEVYYDVAHTPESARAVAESLAELAPLANPESSSVVFGCLRGKDVGRILEALAPLARTLLAVPVRSERGVPPAEIRRSAVGRFARIVLARSASEGLRLARAAAGTDGLVLVVGSDYLIGELLRSPDDRTEPDLSDPGVEDRPNPAVAPTAPVRSAPRGRR